MKECKKCGFACPDEAKFCPACGNKGFKKNEKSSKKKWMICAVSVVLLLAMILYFVLGLIIPVNQMIGSLEEGHGEQARNIYYEKISGNRLKEHNAQVKYTGFLEELSNDFQNNKIEYDNARMKLDAAKFIILDSNFQHYQDEIETLNYTREQFIKGEEAFASGDYEAALNYYGIVVNERGENSDTAEEKIEVCKEKYREQVLEKYEDYFSNKNYDYAYALLSDAANILHDDSQINEKLAMHEQRVEKARIEDILDEAERYADNSEYQSAISVIDEALNSDSENNELIEKRSDLLKRYEAYIVESSKEAMQNENYDKAYNLVSAALEWTDSSQLEKLKKIYKSYLPVKLGEMEIFQDKSKGGWSASSTIQIDEYDEDSYGNTYNNSFCCGKGSVEYLVNFEYQTFSGVIACPKGQTYDTFRASATLKICGDGKVLAEFKDFNLESKAKNFDLDISSYEKISLEWSCKGDNIWLDWGQFATIFDGVFVPIPIEES